MKKPIKLLSLLLATVLLAGCASNGSSNEPESSEPETSESSEESQQSSSQEGKSSSSQAGKSSSSSKSPSSSKASSSSNKSSSSAVPATPGEFTFDDSKLNTPQEIHTANQKKYLNLGIQYYNITSSDLSSCGANGNSNVSTPNKVTVSWNYGVPSGKTVSKYQLVYGQKTDLSDGYTVEGTTSQSVSFYNPYIGDNYFKVIANLSDGSKQESEIKIFKVDAQAPRNISAGNMPNVRDTGGRTTYAGGKIKQGLIYRGAGNNFGGNSSTAINDECKNVLTKQLKIKTEINVANSTSNNLGISSIAVKNCFMDYGKKSTVSGISGDVGLPYSNLSRNAEKIRQVMDILADETNYPVFYHCRIGTDRTGITGMMINGLLGVPFNEIFQDYCFSNFAPIDGQRYPHKSSDPNGDDAAKYIDEIKKLPGATYQEQTYNALLSIGCKAETLNKIIDFMTEGPKATFPGTEKIASGDQLTSDGSKKTTTDYSAPATYYQCGSGKKASMSTTFTAGQKDVVVYLGSTDSSNTTKLANCITLKIDGTEKTIVDKTLFTAGFGTTDQNHRTAYMFQPLGVYDFSAGSHTVEISVKSGTFNIGTISVFDHVTPAA